MAIIFGSNSGAWLAPEEGMRWIRPELLQRQPRGGLALLVIGRSR